MRQYDRKLILEDGSQYPGYGFRGRGGLHLRGGF